MFSLNFPYDWIRAADLWSRKQPLYQLSHNNCAQSWTDLSPIFRSRHLGAFVLLPLPRRLLYLPTMAINYLPTSLTTFTYVWCTYLPCQSFTYLPTKHQIFYQALASPLLDNLE